MHAVKGAAVDDIGISNVLVFASTDKEFKSVPDWMEIYRVDNGVIKKL